MHCLFICTSNADRSVALEKHFQVKYLHHDFRSAGINKYHTSKKGTHLLTTEDLNWADLLVFAEEVHFNKVIGLEVVQPCLYNHDLIEFSGAKFDFEQKNRTYVILKLGKYEKGNINQEYLSKAESILKRYLNEN